MKEELIKEITDIVAQYTDVMELKFGCRVLYSKEPHEPQEVTIGSPYIIVGEEVYNPWNLDERGYLYNIIGRPVTLEDILITIDKKDSHIYVSSNDLRNWRLGKPLHEQSEETLQFIKDLIK